ncbi:MAG: malto-oligosyltrehalose synthase [Flavisolibacter sp.]
MTPLSTYRFQFHKGFNFDQFKNCIEYLNLLGISTVYASPIFQSVPGSNHGYDTLDPHKINPEIGTLDQLKGLTGQLKSLNINWLQDIVPNHMAYSPGNSWLNDVLEKGPFSVYAHFFDECWASSFFKDKLMVPFLGSTLKETIEKNELKIEYKEDRFVFTYYDNSYPIQPGTYFRLIPKTLKNIVESLHQLPEQYVEGLNKTEYAEKWKSILNDIRILMNNETKAKLINTHIDKLNSQATLITEIAEEQHYRFCHWQETDSKINYRRFFTVNGLICLNIQESHVFNVYHEFIKQLINEGIIDGVRVDHIDGLYDPEQYLLRLRELAGEEVYIVVEKITEPGEQLPPWPIQGTTGYDFLAIVNNLFTYKKNEEKLSGFYEEFTNDVGGIKNQLIQKKSFILFNHMAGELENLYQYFLDLDLIEKQRLTTFRIELLKEAIAQFLIYCPVYRYYGNSLPFHHEEYHSVLNLLNRVRKENPDLERAIAILEEVLLKKPLEGNEDRNRRTLHFYQRCMQFTGPLMAKGMEDTLMYTYNRFIGHNEVGDSPESFGITIKEFHLKMNERLKQWPNALNATSTHDTKRGEDARARLNVITDLADEWVELIRNARDQNRSLKKDNGPDENDEYFIYQTIAATYPLLGEETGNYNERIKEYLQKALREERPIPIGQNRILNMKKQHNYFLKLF